MKRIPEPQLMTNPEQVSAYALADFEKPHSNFIKLFYDKFPGSEIRGKAIDLGCGPGDITFRFASEFPEIDIHAIDGSGEMIRYAKMLISSMTGIKERVQFLQTLLDEYSPDCKYDYIISNSLLHHLLDPMVLWKSIDRFCKAGSKIFIMDLLRPESLEEAKSLIDKYTFNEPVVLRNDFHNSLLAAFSADEVRDQIRKAGHDLSVEKISDRHIIIYGSV